MIRVAKKEDFDAILDLSEVFWTHTEYEEPFEREHTRAYVEMAYQHGLLAVVETMGEIVGFAAGIKAPLMGNSSVFAGTELAYWVNPEYRGCGVRLLKFIEDLARLAGVKYWCMVSLQSCDPDNANSIYERMGYHLTEMTYLKVV